MADYRPISYGQFLAAMSDIGFSEVSLPGTWEHAWERLITCRLSQGRYKIRILSSIDITTKVTRDCGSDAIRVLLLDTQGKRPDRPVMDFRVHRTLNALANTVKRAREAYGYVSKHPDHHCTCGSLMVVRGKPGREFLGCTAYPDCKQTRPIQKQAA
jgi:hypothetical protein